MDTDTHCPSCRSSVARATSGAPGEFEKKSDGLLRMLPMFGGAAGGLLYGAIKAAEASTQPTARRPFIGQTTASGSGSREGSSFAKTLIGLVLLLAGGLFLYIGAHEAWTTWNVSRRQATEVTASELGRPEFGESAPDWIRYTATESMLTGVAVKRKRTGGSVEVDARCLLVPMGKQWLIATVPPGFQGNELTGYVVPLDTNAARPMLEQIVKAEPKVTAVLPFEFNGIEGSASDQQLRYTGAAILAFAGLLSVLIGVYLMPFRSRTAVARASGVGAAV
jgi:hypothetical protein